MQNILFTLTGSTIDIATQDGLISLLNSRNDISNIVYRPDKLEIANTERLKISNKSFVNVSFSKTELKNIDFTYCHFENCLFIKSTFESCDFQNCSFKRVNTHKIVFKKTYINPIIFVKNYRKRTESNLAVHLFQQLLNNSQDNEQREFARTANYNFLKWKGILSYNKFKNRLPYPIGFGDFLSEYIPNIIYRLTFGYGLRLRNFIYSFSIIFFLFYLTNIYYWSEYSLKQKDLSIDSFSPSNANLKANLFYTIDITTKLIDSQFQPSSDFGMYMATIQGCTGFVFFSFLITILINKFVK